MREAFHREQIDDCGEIVHMLPDAVIVVDDEGTIMFANPAAYRLFGRTEQELIGKPFGLPVSLGETTRVSIRREGEGTIPVEMRISIVGKREKRYIASLRDISQILETERLKSQAEEQKKVEEVLTRDKNEFERQVRERTGQLLKSQEQLERASRLSNIGVLAATIAHELRNPLAAIKMAAFNIKRKRPFVSVEPQINTINEKLEESDQIISNLLFYSRLKQPNFERLDIGRLIRETMDMSSSRFSYKRVSIRAESNDFESVPIMGDSLQLKEVFFNIINNAFDAVPEGTGEIIVSVRRRAGDRVEAAVRDNGPGMDPETLKRMFEPFFTTKSKGTGLGLTVTKDIVTMHHGEIAIESEKGKGTEVFIRLPTDPDGAEIAAERSK